MIKLVVFIMSVFIGMFVFLPIYAGIKSWVRALALRIRIRLTGTTQKLEDGAIWQGMTTGQLKIAVGKPDQIETKADDAVEKHVYRYFPGKNGGLVLKVMVEKGVVVGWFYK